MIIGVAVALAIGLVVLGGSALVNSMKSEAKTPGTSAPVAQQQQSAPAEKRTVYANIKVLRSVKLFAAAPNNGPVYLNGTLNRGDERDIVWKDLDLTISDTSAIKMFVGGKPFRLPSAKNLAIQFVGGTPKIVG